MAPLERIVTDTLKRIDALGRKYARRRVIVVAAFLAFWALNTLAVTYGSVSGLLSDVAVGRPAPRTIEAPRAVQVRDEARTSAERRKAADAVKPVYAVDLKAEALARTRVREFFDIVAQQRGGGGSVEGALRKLAERGFTSFTKADVERALAASDSELAAIREAAEGSLRTLFLIRVRPDELELMKSRVESVVAPTGLPGPDAKLAEKVVRECLVPNYLPDAAETERLRAEAVARVAPVVIRKQAGEVVVREGEIVDREDYLVLEALGLTNSRAGFVRAASGALFVGLILVLLGAFLRLFAPGVYARLPHLMLPYVVVTVHNALTGVLNGSNAGFVVTVPLPVVAANVTLGPTVAAAVFVAALSLTLLYPQNTLPLVLTVLFSGVLAFAFSHSIKQQRQLLLIGAGLAFLMATLAAGVGFYFELGLSEIARDTLFAAIGGFGSIVLALGLVPFLESVFRVTTPIRLLELANPNHPLLRELMTHAPGTYNHSVMTGNLAEAAAQAIGANSALARVGGYFHDIGKLRRPTFFVENQIGGENPHDRTSPALSRLIISSHVKDGVEIAREHRLPDEVVNIIAQHHGTTLIKYFYEKAVREGNGDVDERSFRYLEKRPETREAAIVMLADSVEAAARTISRPTPNRVEQVVRKIIRDKLDDGQLDLSDLTLHDLERIAGAFCRMLAGFYHLRVEYAGAAPEVHVLRRKAARRRQAKES